MIIVIYEENMSFVDSPPVFEELLDILAEGANTQKLLAFRLTAEKQARLDVLLERNRQGKLNKEDAAELDTFEQVEHVVRLLKARLLQKQRT